MINESEMARNFIDYLKNNGYPEESITAEYAISENIRADIVIIDPSTRIPVQLFELKKIKNKSTIDYGIKQIKASLSQLENKNIPAYIVFPSDEDDHNFEIIDMNSIKPIEESPINQAINKSTILNYKAQKNARINEEANIVKGKKKTTLDIFSFICWFIAFCLVLVIIMTKLKMFSIDANDMIIIGAIIALVLMPFASKLKVLGIEFERYIIKNKE